LLEYKSPDDYISISDFYKVYGYACLYASFEKIEITRLTISFVASRHPGKLLKHLENVNMGIPFEQGQCILRIYSRITHAELAEDAEGSW